MEHEQISKLLLIVGVQRSGTTLLASMLGRHSEINMLFESTTHDVRRLMGKQYAGNKLLAWRQIRMNRRGSKWGHLMNRISNADFGRTRKHHKVRPYPTSSMSIADYLALRATIITITRDESSTVGSMVRRAGMTERQSRREWARASEIIEQLNDFGAIHVPFDRLVTEPVEVMKSVTDRLGLKYEERMLEGSRYNVVYPYDRIMKEKASKDGGDTG